MLAKRPVTTPLRLNAQDIGDEVEERAEAEQIGHEAEVAQVVVGVAHQLDQQHAEKHSRGQPAGER